MKNARPNNILKALANIFVRFNVTIFIVTLVGGLVIAVIILTNIMQPPDATSGSNNVNNGSSSGFDDATIKRLNTLRTSSEGGASSQDLPSGRINPFAG